MYDCTEIQTDKLNALNRKTDWNKLKTRMTKGILKNFTSTLENQVKQRIPEKKTLYDRKLNLRSIRLYGIKFGYDIAREIKHSNANDTSD